jgi:hypothetical protein
LLIANLDKVNWSKLSSNPNAVHLLQKNLDKVNWYELSQNPSIFTYDYVTMKKQNKELKEQIISFGSRPERIQRIIDVYQIEDIDELENYI